MRLLQHIQAKPGKRHSAKIYRDPEWNEYRAKFYCDNVYMGNQHDYHTDDEIDAMDTAAAILDKLDAS